MKMTREQAILEYLYQKSLSWEERDQEKLQKIKKELKGEKDGKQTKEDKKSEPR